LPAFAKYPYQVSMSHGKQLLLLFGLLVAAALWLKHGQSSLMQTVEADGVTYMGDDDPVMMAAFIKGRETLDSFLAIAAVPPPNTESYAVKVAISQGGQKEYFWINPFTIDGDSFSWQLANTPQIVSNVKEGETIEFRRADIVDWTYENTAEHRMYGNFTACALLVRQSKEDVAAFKKEYGLECEG
jgi:uncharacterized protein YegJ (DUF2314 family)